MFAFLSNLSILRIYDTEFPQSRSFCLSPSFFHFQSDHTEVSNHIKSLLGLEVLIETSKAAILVEICPKYVGATRSCIENEIGNIRKL